METRVEIRHLRAFVAAVEAGSFSAGARSLNVSQPALSQNIAALEEALGLRLVDRGPSGVAPSPAGSVFLCEARNLVSRFEQALASASSFSPTASRGLRIAVPFEMTIQPLTDALSKLAASPFRGTRVEIRQLSCPQQLAALKDGELDLALVRERPVGEGLDVAIVTEEPMGALVAAQQAKDLKLESSKLRLDDLASLAWLSFPKSNSPAWHDHVTAVLRNHGIGFCAQAAQATELVPEVKLAQLSLGGRFALAARSSVQGLPGALVWLPLVGEPLIRRTWVAWPEWSRRRDLAG